MEKYKLNEEKMIAWAVAQGNKVYEVFPTRSEARVVCKDYSIANNNEKFHIIKLVFGSVAS